MGLGDMLDLNNDGDVNGGEAFFGLGTAGALGFAIGADEAQYAAHKQRKADRKNRERRYRDLENECDELRDEVKRLKKHRHNSSYWDDCDDSWDDDDEPLFSYEEFYRDYEEQHGILGTEKSRFYDSSQDEETPEEELKRLREEVAFYKRLLNEQIELTDKLTAEITALSDENTQDAALTEPDAAEADAPNNTPVAAAPETPTPGSQAARCG